MSGSEWGGTRPSLSGLSGVIVAGGSAPLRPGVDDIYVVTDILTSKTRAERSRPVARIWEQVTHWSFRLVKDDCVEPYMEPYLVQRA